jgi:uncharacterized iron-regulated membrane protein
MQSAADRTDGQVEDFGDVFVAATVDFAEDEHDAMFFGKLGHALSDLAAAFLEFDLFSGSGVFVNRFHARPVAAVLDRNYRAFPPPLGGSRVEGNAI